MCTECVEIQWSQHSVCFVSLHLRPALAACLPSASRKIPQKKFFFHVTFRFAPLRPFAVFTYFHGTENFQLFAFFRVDFRSNFRWQRRNAQNFLLFDGEKSKKKSKNEKEFFLHKIFKEFFSLILILCSQMEYTQLQRNVIGNPHSMHKCTLSRNGPLCVLPFFSSLFFSLFHSCYTFSNLIFFF